MAKDERRLTPAEAVKAWHDLLHGEATEPTVVAHALVHALWTEPLVRKRLLSAALKAGRTWPDADRWIARATTKLATGTSLDRLIAGNVQMAEFLALHPSETMAILDKVLPARKTAAAKSRSKDSRLALEARIRAELSSWALKNSAKKRAAVRAGSVASSPR